VLVITPHSRINQQVAWLNLLTLPVRPEASCPKADKRSWQAAAFPCMSSATPGRPRGRPAATSTELQALPLEQLEELAVGAAFSDGVALLGFQVPADLATWLAANTAANPDT
jgi:hypothetical protein